MEEVQIADEHLPVRIGGDAALLRICQDNPLTGRSRFRLHLCEYPAQDWKKHIESTDWEKIVEQSGISWDRIEKTGNAIAKSERMIVCWAKG